MTIFRPSSLIAFSGRYRPVLREDLERSARDDVDDPVFPYPHLKATLTSWQSIQDVAGASKYEVVEDARKMLRLVWSTREPREYAGFCGVTAAVAHVRPSSRGPGAILIPGSIGEEPLKPTVSTVLPSSRGPVAIRVPGSRVEEHVIPTASTLRPSSRGPGAICVPGCRGEEVTSALGAPWPAPGSGVLPVSATSGMGSSSMPPFGSQLVRKVPGWHPLGFLVGLGP